MQLWFHTQISNVKEGSPQNLCR